MVASKAMLSPEVLIFPAKASYRRVKTHSLASGIPDDLVADSVKVLLPKAVHPFQELREALSSETDFYEADHVPLQCLLWPHFIRTFVQQGQLFIQSCAGPVSPETCGIFVVPSGWMYILLDQFDAERLCLTGHVDLALGGGQKLIGLQLGTHKAGHLDQVLASGNALQLPSRLRFAWFPDDPEVCPSSLAKFFHDQGASVTTCSAHTSLHRVQCRLPRDLDRLTAEDAELLENWIGAAFLQLEKLDSLYPDLTDDPMQILCVDAVGVFGARDLRRIACSLQDHLNAAPDVPWASLTARWTYGTSICDTCRRERWKRLGQCCHQDTWILSRNRHPDVTHVISKF